MEYLEQNGTRTEIPIDVVCDSRAAVQAWCDAQLGTASPAPAATAPAPATLPTRSSGKSPARPSTDEE